MDTQVQYVVMAFRPGGYCYHMGSTESKFEFYSGSDKRAVASFVAEIKWLARDDDGREYEDWEFTYLIDGEEVCSPFRDIENEL